MKDVLAFTLGWVLMLAYVFPHLKEKQPEIKPCICVTYSQYALWSEKYNRYVSENKPDSVAKYAELLNQIK